MFDRYERYEAMLGRADLYGGLRERTNIANVDALRPKPPTHPRCRCVAMPLQDTENA